MSELLQTRLQPDVVLRLLDVHSQVSFLKFIEYPPSPTFQEVTSSGSLSFQETLDRRLRHGGKNVIEHRMSRLEMKSRALSNLLDTLPSERALALTSPVELSSGGSAHIPMADFRCSHATKTEEDISIAMQLIEPAGGYLLASHNSYHYYGKGLLTKAQWHAFIGRCLLLEPLVDVRYMGHCLMDGFAALRISKQGIEGNFPTVVAHIHSKPEVAP